MKLIRIVLCVASFCAIASATASQPVVGILQPFLASSTVTGAFSLPNPQDPSNPFLIFGTEDAGGGLRIVTRASIASGANIVAMNDPKCGQTYCVPTAVFPYNTSVCWLNSQTMGCGEPATGVVTWTNLLPAPMSDESFYPVFGMIGPNMFWYQAQRGYNVVVSLANGSVVNDTMANADFVMGVSATVCTSTVCFGKTSTTGGNAVVAYNPVSSAPSLWVVVTAASGAGNLVVGNASNGHTIVVGADGRCVYGIDATTGQSIYSMSYAGTVFDPSASYSSGAANAGVCGPVVVVVGATNVHVLSLETGASVGTFPYGASNAANWEDFLCYKGTNFYVGTYGDSSVTAAIFGAITGTAVAPVVTFSMISARSTDSNPWSNDGVQTVFHVYTTLRAYNIVSGSLAWDAAPAGSTIGLSYPVQLVGTPIYCFVGPLRGAQVECIDISVPATTFARNSSFLIGVNGDTIVTGPNSGDGACILDTATLQLLVDTAVAAGDTNANGAGNSNTGSGSSSQSTEFAIETNTVPITAITPDQIAIAIVVATLQVQNGFIDCVRSFDLKTGIMLWVHCLSTTVPSTPVTSPTAVIVMDSNWMLHSLDISTGKKQWDVVPSMSGASTSKFSSLVFDAEFRNIYTSTNRYFICISASTGVELWAQQVSSSMSPNGLLSPLLAGGVLYTCYTTSGPMYCDRRDPLTGQTRGESAVILNPSAVPMLMLYKGRFLVNTADSPTLSINGGLFEINWANLELSHTIVSLPSLVTVTRDVLLLGIADDLVAFKIRTTKVWTTTDSIEVRKLSNGALVWQAGNTITFGPRTETILSQSTIANVNAAVIATASSDFIFVFDWYTGAMLRAIPRDSTNAPNIQFSSAGNGTLLYLPSAANPFELHGYPNLRPPQQFPSPAPQVSDVPLPTLPPAPTPVPTTAVPPTPVPPPTTAAPSPLSTPSPPTLPTFTPTPEWWTPSPPSPPTPSPPNPWASPDDDDSGPNPAGLGIGITFAVFALFGIIFYCVRRQLRSTMAIHQQVHQNLMQSMTPIVVNGHQQQELVYVQTAHGYMPVMVSSPRGGHHHYYDDDDDYYDQQHTGPAAQTNDKYDGADGGHYEGKDEELVDDGGAPYPGLQEDNAQVPVKKKERGKSVFGLKK